jgi:hypothetical protein
LGELGRQISRKEPRDVVDFGAPFLSRDKNIHAGIHTAAFEVESVGDTRIRFDADDRAPTRRVHHQLSKRGVGSHEHLRARTRVCVRGLRPFPRVSLVAETCIDIIKIEVVDLHTATQIFA